MLILSFQDKAKRKITLICKVDPNKCDCFDVLFINLNYELTHCSDGVRFCFVCATAASP